MGHILLRLPLLLGVIVFFVSHSESFHHYSHHFSKQYMSLHRLSDFVRPPAEFNLANVVTVESLLNEYDELAKIEGVYAIQDMDGEIRYVGASMVVAREISRHLAKHGTTVVNSVRIQTFTNPKPEAMDAYKLELVRQTSAKGNLEESSEWEDKAVVRSIATEPVVVAAVDPIPSSTGSSSSSKANIMSRLIEVVDVDGDRKAAASAAIQTGSVIESPFSVSSSSSSSKGVTTEDNNSAPLDVTDPNAYVVGPSGSAGLELTKENVDKVLDEIRPYLIADGGNVAVVSIDDFTRSISLTLQGACGSCPSSTVRFIAPTLLTLNLLDSLVLSSLLSMSLMVIIFMLRCFHRQQ